MTMPHRILRSVERDPGVGLRLDGWREVCRHLDIDESGTNLASIIGPVVALDRRSIRSFDPARLRLETVGAGGSEPPGLVRTELSDRECAAIAEWGRRR